MVVSAVWQRIQFTIIETTKKQKIGTNECILARNKKTFIKTTVDSFPDVSALLISPTLNTKGEPQLTQKKLNLQSTQTQASLKLK